MDLAQYARDQAPLKGIVEGDVMERLADGDQPAEGVTVTIDEGAARGRVFARSTPVRFRQQQLRSGCAGKIRIAGAAFRLVVSFRPSVVGHEAEVARR